MDKATYNACMAEGLQGKTLSKEERKLEFCVLSKTCSGKAATPAEAKKICLETPPAPPKPKHSKKAYMDPDQLAACVVPKLSVLKLTEHNIHDALSSALGQCMGGKKPKKVVQLSDEQKEALKVIETIMNEYGTTKAVLQKR